MKLKDKFTELKSRDEGALIAYICAGDPTPEATAEIVRGCADIIQLSRPFSDPIADGPTIQASAIMQSDEPAYVPPLRNLSPFS
ncbi:MAG: tryptophan synthase subunit alpha [Methanosarcinales archaeon]|nr:tryptophan synthase subunit alpha [Methanosarcinales archaeon]